MQQQGTIDFKHLFESGPESNLVLLPDLTITAVSDAYLEATMTTRQSIIGQNFFAVFSGSQGDLSDTGAATLSASFNYVLKNLRPHMLAVQRYDMKGPGGKFEERFWSIVNKPVLNDNNEVEYIIHKVEDVTAFIDIQKDKEVQGKLVEQLREHLLKMEIITYKRAEEIQLLNRKLEEQVAQKTAEIRETFERITDAFIGLDKNDNLTYVNHRAENLLELSAKDFGKNIWEIFTDGIPEIEFTKVFIESKTNSQYRSVDVYSSKYHTWFEIHLYPSPSGMSIFFRDTTERKTAEEQLKASERRYRFMFEGNPLPMWMLSMPERNFIAVNESAVRHYGYTKDEFLHMNASDIRPPEESDRFRKSLKDMKPGVYNAGIWKHAKKDGTIIDVEIIAHDSYYDGKPARLILANDISERVKAEDALRHAEEINRLIMSSSLNAIVCIDREDKIILWNPQAEKIFGWTNEEIIGLSLVDTIIPATYRADHLKGMKHYLKTGEGPIMRKLVEITAMHKDGNEFYVELAIIPIKENGNEFFCAFIQDITERKKAEEQLLQSNVQLRQLASHLQHVREEEQKRIARDVHDELGQQLTGLKMDVSWIRKKITSETMTTPIEEKLQEMAQLLDSSVKTIRRIASELRPSMLDDLGLIAALEWQAREFERRFSIPVAFSHLNAREEFDSTISTGLFRVYQESLTNIARHAEANKVSTELIANTKYVRLTISDDGKGFDVEETDNNRSLGILGMKERALMMNGELKINSNPGGGTTIVITVPLPRSNIKENEKAFS